MMSEGATCPIKMVPSLCGFPPFKNFNTPPPPNLYALPSPINMTTMIRQNTKSPLTARFPQANLITRLFTAPQLTLDHY